MSTITASDWWRRSLAGERTPINANEPQPGYYATRSYRGGPMMPARIWTENGKAYCMVAGERRDALRDWPYLAARPITADEYSRLTGTLGTVAGPEVDRVEARMKMRLPF